MGLRVPRAQRQVEVGGIRNPNAGTPNIQENAPAEAFGGGQAGGALTRGLDKIAKVYEETRKSANDAAVQDVYGQLKREKLRQAYDPKSGALSKRGKDAFGIVDEYGKSFNKYADDLENSLSNDEQKAMFRVLRDREYTDFDGDLKKHTLVESRQYMKKATDSLIEVEQDEAGAKGVNDPAFVENKIRQQEILITDYAQKEGLDEATIKIMRDDARRKTHGRVVDNMLAGGMWKESSAYVDKYAADFGEDAKEIKRKIAVEEERAQRQAKEEANKTIGNILEQSGGRIDKVPKAMWQNLTVSERASFRSYADNLKDGTEPKTDWKEYYNLKRMASTPELRDEFLRTDLMQYRSKLGNAEFKDLVGDQDGLKGGNDKTAKLLDSFRSDSEIVNTALRQAGIDPNSKDEDVQTRIALFRKSVGDKQVQLQQRTGKPASSKDMETIVDSLMIETVTDKGFIWDTKKRKFEMTIDDVPEDDRKEFEKRLKAKGIPVTDQIIIDLFSHKASK